MPSFGAYSAYYDLLYRDKDYEREAGFIAAALRRNKADVRSVLELGCGTGRHAALLAEDAFEVHGLDLSTDMLQEAERRKAQAPTFISDRLSFAHGDARTYDAGRQFDAVVSLFHVVSYQTSNEDLANMFNNAARHLREGGVFLFDFWYGPAVLAQRPRITVKKMASDDHSVVRIATPTLKTEQSVVEVNYHVMVRDQRTRTCEDVFELHRMRYIFLTEVEFLAKSVGLKVLEAGEWLTGAAPSEDTWGVLAALQK